jgi:hypothetical protein
MHFRIILLGVDGEDTVEYGVYGRWGHIHRCPDEIGYTGKLKWFSGNHHQ